MLRLAIVLGLAVLPASAPLAAASDAADESLRQDDGRRLFKDLHMGERADATKDDFCSFNGKSNLITDRPVAAGSKDGDRHIEVTRRADGVHVLLYPGPEVHDTRGAVAELSLFLSESAVNQCARIRDLWPVAVTTVHGLRVINRDGKADFDYQGR